MSKRPLRRLRKLIVGGKVDVNTCVDEITLLGELAEAGDLELVTLMISLGADVNFREIPRVSTPLINATIVGNLKIVKLLLHSGADLVRSDAVFSGLNYALYSKKPPHESITGIYS